MITFQNISKIYQVGDQEVKALDDVSFSIEKGKFTIILGPSGSGKSTTKFLLPRVIGRWRYNSSTMEFKSIFSLQWMACGSGVVHWAVHE